MILGSADAHCARTQADHRCMPEQLASPVLGFSSHTVRALLSEPTHSLVCVIKVACMAEICSLLVQEAEVWQDAAGAVLRSATGGGCFADGAGPLQVLGGPTESLIPRCAQGPSSCTSFHVLLSSRANNMQICCSMVSKLTLSTAGKWQGW